MTRIPSHSIEDAPQAARSLLAEYAETELDIPAGTPGSGPADAGPPAPASGAGS